MLARQFIRSLTVEKVPPVVFLIGEELELHRMAIERIARLKLGGDGAGIGMERFDGSDIGLVGILDATASGGLFSAERVLVIRNAEGLSAAAGSTELKLLERYLDNPDPALSLIFSASSANRSKHPFKMLAAKTAVVECDRLKGSELRQWIEEFLHNKGYALSGRAVDYATDLIGNDLLMIRNALEKVMLFCGERNRIEYEDLEKSLGTMREHAVWELTSAIGARNAAESIRLLARLLDEGKHPLQVATALQFQFRQLLVVKSLEQKRLTPKEIAVEAGIRYFADRVLAQARGFGAKELISAYNRLFHLEDALKSAGIDARFLMEKWILEVCGSRASVAKGIKGPR